MRRIVLITGGSKGIGAECVRKFAHSDFDVVFTYFHSEQKAQDLVKELSQVSNVVAYKCDVSSYTEMQELGEFIKSTFGKCDVLVSNAGIAKIAPIVDVCEKDFDEIINTNLKGAFNSVKAVLPLMLNQKGGKIVFVSSVWGLEGASCESVYCASKCGIVGFMSSLAKEFGPSNINVNCVAPGLIDTDMNSELTENEKRTIINEIPLERIGTPEDVANAVVFLSSEKASYITNTTLKVDGGWV